MTTLVSLATTAVLAITGVGAAVGAWASTLVQAAGAAAQVIAASAQAMLANVCARATTALIQTGDMGRAIKATASSDAMKSLLHAGLRAGAIAGVTAGLGIAAPSAPSSIQEAFAPDRILQHLQYQTFTQAVGCTVDAMMGDKDAFDRLGAHIAAGTVGAVGAGAIGCAYSKDLMDAVSHKVLHASVGALSGSILGGREGAFSGAIGTMVAETYADMFKPAKPLETIQNKERELGRSLTQEEFGDILESYNSSVIRTAEVSKVIAAASVFAVGGDVSVAHLTACSAIDHNFLPTAFALASVGYTAWCGYEIYSAYEEGGPIAALKQLGIEVVLTAVGVGAGKMVFKIGSMMYPTAELAVASILSQNPTLKAILGSLTDKVISGVSALNASTIGHALAKSDAFVVKMAERVGLGTVKISAEGVSETHSTKMLTYQGGRTASGSAHVSGELVDAPTLLRGIHANAGNVPLEIAKALEGKTFSSFDAFRSEFWKTVGKSKYAGEFDRINIERMARGNAPAALESQQVGRRVSYELHHKTPLHDGGSTYDLSNILITSPRYHLEVLEKTTHFGVRK